MLNVVMLSATNKSIMVNVIMLSVIMLSVIMLSVIMLSVVILNVMAPNYPFLKNNRETIVKSFENSSLEKKVFFGQNEKLIRLLLLLFNLTNPFIQK
jgi:hypothetical protein